MSLIAVVLLVGAARFEIQPHHIEPVKPQGMVDKAVLKGRIPWCKGTWAGEAGWSEGRLSRSVEGGSTVAPAALQLCESPEEPTWIALARNLVQKVMNNNNLSQEDAIAAIENAMAREAKEKANEGKEPSDEERFAFGDDDYTPHKPEPGVDAVKPGKMAWCDGLKVTEKWDARRINRTVSGKYGIEGTVSGARQICLRPNDPTWQKEGAFILQKWMNWTHLSQAEAERSLKARVHEDTFVAERTALCKAIEPSSEISHSAKAYAQAQQLFFGCTGRDFQTMWQERGRAPDSLVFYVDPEVNPPSEIIRIIMLYDMVWDPGEHEYPSKDPSENANLLRYAVAQADFAALDKAALEKTLAAAPYNEYARVVAMETVGHLRGWQRIYETAVDKLAKGDADYTEVLRNAPKKGWTKWTTVMAPWKAELARSNAFEAKLSQPSRKVLKGCQAELQADANKVVKSYKGSDYNEVKTKISSDPVAMLLLSRLSVCAAYEKVPGVSGVYEQLVTGGRDLRGPRSGAYYAVVDALAEALKDRPKLALQLSSFHWNGGSLSRMYSNEFNFSGGLGQGPDSSEPKGVVATVAKKGDVVEIKFKHTKYTYPEANCVDDKFHPLKIESNGTIRYNQKCTYTGKMLSYDTTPRPITVAPQMATNVKPGGYVVGQESGASGQGIVHLTKSNAASKKIDTFYGFDL